MFIFEWNDEIIHCEKKFMYAAFRCRALFTLDTADECIFIHFNIMDVDYENKVKLRYFAELIKVFANHICKSRFFLLRKYIEIICFAILISVKPGLNLTLPILFPHISPVLFLRLYFKKKNLCTKNIRYIYYITLFFIFHLLNYEKRCVPFIILKY